MAWIDMYECVCMCVWSIDFKETEEDDDDKKKQNKTHRNKLRPTRATVISQQYNSEFEIETETEKYRTARPNNTRLTLAR